MTTRQISTDRAPAPAGPYSQGIVANGFVFTAGQTPHDPVTDELIGEGIEEQTEFALRHVLAVLAAQGLDFSDVVKATVHLQDPQRDFAGFNAVYAKHFVEPFPVRTTVGSTLGDFLVEIDVVAALRI